MEDPDELIATADKEEIFSKYDPEEFAFDEVRSVWKPPCWIDASLSFRAISKDAKERYWLPLAISFHVDAFAKTPRQSQLSNQYWDFESRLPHGSNSWKELLWTRYPALQDAVARPEQLFAPPMRFIARTEFEKADLSSVLKGSPSDFEVYIADDVNSDKHHIAVLRIHSTLSIFCQKSSYLWYEKRIPLRLHEEDILPWFRALVRRLPKKLQPVLLEPWEERLSGACPGLLVPTPKTDTPWVEFPTLALVFGTKNQIGTAAIYRIRREHIQAIVRDGSIVLVKGTVENRYEKDSTKLLWTFHLFTRSILHAQRLEHRLLSGGEVHFGIGDDIDAMMGQNKEHLEVLDVPIAEIRRLGFRKGNKLITFDPVRFRHKSYSYWPGSEPTPHGATRLL